MSDSEIKTQNKVSQFRNISEVDKAVVNRLVQDRNELRQRSGDMRNLDTASLAHVFRRTLREASDIRNIFQTMPDLHLPRDLLVSAIVSPGDLSKTDLIFSNSLKGADSSLVATLTNSLKEFFIEECKLETKVPEWVDDALIWSGAHPILIMPESSIDRMINGGMDDASMESVASYAGEWTGDWYRPKGVFGLRMPTVDAASYASFESVSRRIDNGKMAEYHTIKAGSGKKVYNLPIRVTDNMAALRTPAVQQIKRSMRMERAYGTPAFESKRRERRVASGKAPSYTSVYSNFFKQPQRVKRSRLEVVPTGKQSGDSNVGHPLVYHLPTECVIPVCVPGDEKNHVGYIVLLDANGFPISYSRRLNFYDDIRNAGAQEMQGSSSQAAGETIQFAKEAIHGGVNNASNAQIDRLTNMVSTLVCADIVARLKTGLMGGDFELSRNEHIDRLMLARSMKNQMTTMLYVPSELMVYMAYDYNEYGIGKSILEDAKATAAMRAAVTVANVIGATKNAIPGKDINIELDPDDGDPLGTATFMANEALGLAYHQFPMGISSTVGLAEQLQLSAFSVNVTGNPRFPEVKTTITPRESVYAQVDTELQQQLRDDMTRVFSLTPEMVDGINQPDFATSVVQNNLMLLKRVMVYQGKTNPQVTDYVRIFTYNSGILVDKLMELIDQNSKLLPEEFKDAPEDFLEEFLNHVQVKLPEPETDNLAKQIETFNNFSEALDKALPAWIKEEYFDGYSPDFIKDALPTVVEAIKGIILRDWMRKRGIFKELDVFTTAEDGSPLLNLTEEMGNHVDAVMKAIGSYASKVANDAKKRKTIISKLNDDIKEVEEVMAQINPETVPEGGEDDGFAAGDDDNPDVNDGEEGNDEDFGFGDDGADAGDPAEDDRLEGDGTEEETSQEPEIEEEEEEDDTPPSEDDTQANEDGDNKKK